MTDQAQSDEALITEARAEAELFRRGDYLHGTAQRMRTAATLDRLADCLASLHSDHAEAFAGKVVLSQAAFEALRGGDISPCPDCGTSLHLVCLECHPVGDGEAVSAP